MTDTTEPTDLPTSSRPRIFRKVAVSVLMLAVVLGAWWGWDYHTHGQYLEATNDAQVAADSVFVAPRVSGYVAEVFVADNQDVTAGTPLLRIDPRDYQAKSAQASAQIAVSDAVGANVRSTIEEQRAGIEQARAQLAAMQSKARYDAEQVRRYTPLVASGAEQAQQLALLRTGAEQSAAQVRAQAAGIEAQQRRVATLQAQIQQAEAQARGSKAQLDAANVDVEATLIRASENGRVGDKSVTVGQFVAAGTRLLTLVPLDKLYVVANFKETELALMRPGQPVSITVDALGGRTVKGRVESIAPGTGSSFSLIAPSNATGNFTKIVQRVPVRIRLDVDPALRRLLVPGLSVTATVDTVSAKDEQGR